MCSMERTTDCGRKKLRCFLRLKECYTVITRVKTDTDNADWDENDLEAMIIIYSAI